MIVVTYWYNNRLSTFSCHPELYTWLLSPWCILQSLACMYNSARVNVMTNWVFPASLFLQIEVHSSALFWTLYLVLNPPLYLICPWNVACGRHQIRNEACPGVTLCSYQLVAIIIISINIKRDVWMASRKSIETSHSTLWCTSFLIPLYMKLAS